VINVDDRIVVFPIAAHKNRRDEKNKPRDRDPWALGFGEIELPTRG